jgi:threonyl-tRNA synthetase
VSATIRVTLPDGSVREVPSGTTSRQVAEGIGAGLARAALAARVNGSIWDLDRPLEADTTLSILTERDPDALEVLRHSSAHIMATAVRELFPSAGIGFGPPIEDGFYYDFQVDRPFTPEDLARIETKMAEVAARDYPFTREVVDRAEANRRFADDPLKLERISELGDNETITVYTDGPFQDLCRGPHIPRTGRLKHFKLLSAAGAYWRGDEHRQMLQRIYGTAWFKKEELDAYLHRLEESRKRDHRRLGKELDLFMFHPFAPGAPFYTDRGTTMVRIINDYIRSLNQRAGYQEIKTPLLYNKGLWEISGHWGKYRENMFLVLDKETGEHDFSLKPMNCPSHHLYFGTRKHSYRELPLGFATFDVLHRNEVSGALGGLTRVRQFQQDDCHIYLMGSQIATEVRRITDMILELYATFGLTATLKFATRPEQRRCDVGPRRGRPPRRARGHGQAVRAQGGRRRVLRAQDRLRSLRLDRAQVAAGYDPARLRRARAVRSHLRGRGQRRAPAGGHSPRHGWIVRALPGDPDRALRRRVPGLASARASAGHPDLGRADPGRPRPRRPAHGRGHPDAPRRPARNAQLPDP